MRLRNAVLAILILVVVIAALIVWRLQPKSVELSRRQTFDTSDEGWFAYGGGARVRVTHEREHVKEGAGALELEDAVLPQQYGSAVLLVADNALASMRRLRFWIQTDDDTAAAVVLTEKSPHGGSYSAWFWSPKRQWQLVELVPEDFILSEGSADAKDPNGRLDPAEIQGVGFIDLGQFFGLLSSDPHYPLFLKATAGSHYLWVDDFEVLRDSPQTRGAPRTQIGDPSRGFVSWITLGGATLALSNAGNPLARAAYEVTYDQIQGKHVAIAHGLSNLELGHATRFNFETASLKPATVMVYLEERNPGNDVGPRYSSSFDVAGGSSPFRKTLALSDFVYDATSAPDSDNRVTPGRLRSISLIDVTGAQLSAPVRNTLWISTIEAIAQ